MVFGKHKQCTHFKKKKVITPFVLSQENPYRICEAHTEHHQNVNVLRGIINHTIVRSYFLKENLRAERDFLSLELAPVLTDIFHAKYYKISRLKTNIFLSLGIFQRQSL